MKIILIYIIFLLVFPIKVFAEEIVFSNPTFGDISATASEDGSVNNSYPIA